MVAVQNIKNVFKLYGRQHNNYVARRRRILAAITLKSQKHKQLFKKWRNLLKHKTKLFLTCNLSNLSFTVNFPKIFRRTSSDSCFFSDHTFVPKRWIPSQVCFKKFSGKFSYDTFEITNSYDAKIFFMTASVLLKH